MSVDENRGELIRQALEKGGFNPRSSPMEGDSYRYFIRSIKGEERENMEIYKKRNSEKIVFSGTVFLAPNHLEQYRKLEDDIRNKFDSMLENTIQSYDVDYDITEDERGFAVWISSNVDHNLLNIMSLQKCLGSVIDAQVKIFNFFMDFFYGKIKL